MPSGRMKMLPQEQRRRSGSSFLLARVQTEEARHLYRNFADSTDDLEVALSLETPDKPLRLRLSRREVDIMLFFVSKGQTAMDCHYLMPYRSRRKMRKVAMNQSGC